jgi:hypothetical protein
LERVFRRATQWAAEVLTTPGEKLALPSLDFSMGMSSIYEWMKV